MDWYKSEYWNWTANRFAELINQEDMVLNTYYGLDKFKGSYLTLGVVGKLAYDIYMQGK